MSERVSNPGSADLPTWEPGIDMTGVLTWADDSETLVEWLRRVAVTPDLRIKGKPHVECRPDMLLEAADEIERLKRVVDQAKAVCGRNNCNCPGAHRVRAAVEEVTDNATR